MKQTDIEALIRQFGASDWNELHLQIGEDEIYLSKNADAALKGVAPAAPAPMAAAAASAPAAGAATAPAAAAPAADIDRTGWIAITAPNLGTFYRAPTPEAAPYVTVGTQVAADTEICLVEIMKLFTTISAGLSGTVREIVAQDGDMVEFGATLMWIEAES